MLDPRVKKLADMLVNYSMEVKKGEKVMLNFIGSSTEPLVRELISSVVRAGGVPFWVFDDSPLSRRFVAEADENQMTVFGDVHKSMMQQMDCYCGVRGSDNKFEMAGLPSEQMKNYKKLYGEKVHMQVRVPDTRWVVMRWPNASMAQQSGKSTEDFENFYFDVCTLDYAKMSAAMEKLVERMHRTDRVRIVAKDTDISFSTKDIPAIKCDGKLNIPDGEVYTAPVKNSVNGRITDNTPSTQEGVMYEGVSLEFKDGKIVSIDAKNDVDSLREVFEVDEGAKYVGEFAIGVNPYILHPMNDTLFDEKIAGSIHFTPGNSYDEAPNGNKSSLHWDMVLIQREDYGGGELFFDDELVRKDGIFVVDDLKCLNPEELK
ncbi:MAG: aminopeptidase [Planctomycetota bacterium]|nr:aminopeptidase [Planctomycetota bacterium]